MTDSFNLEYYRERACYCCTGPGVESSTTMQTFQDNNPGGGSAQITKVRKSCQLYKNGALLQFTAAGSYNGCATGLTYSTMHAMGFDLFPDGTTALVCGYYDAVDLVLHSAWVYEFDMTTATPTQIILSANCDEEYVDVCIVDADIVVLLMRKDATNVIRYCTDYSTDKTWVDVAHVGSIYGDCATGYELAYTGGKVYAVLRAEEEDVFILHEADDGALGGWSGVDTVDPEVAGFPEEEEPAITAGGICVNTSSLVWWCSFGEYDGDTNYGTTIRIKYTGGSWGYSFGAESEFTSVVWASDVSEPSDIYAFITSVYNIGDFMVLFLVYPSAAADDPDSAEIWFSGGGGKFWNLYRHIEDGYTDLGMAYIFMHFGNICISSDEPEFYWLRPLIYNTFSVTESIKTGCMGTASISISQMSLEAYICKLNQYVVIFEYGVLRMTGIIRSVRTENGKIHITFNHMLDALEATTLLETSETTKKAAELAEDYLEIEYHPLKVCQGLIESETTNRALLFNNLSAKQAIMWTLLTAEHEAVTHSALVPTITPAGLFYGWAIDNGSGSVSITYDVTDPSVNTEHIVRFEDLSYTVKTYTEIVLYGSSKSGTYLTATETGDMDTWGAISGEIFLKMLNSQAEVTRVAKVLLALFTMYDPYLFRITLTNPSVEFHIMQKITLDLTMGYITVDTDLLILEVTYTPHKCILLVGNPGYLLTNLDKDIIRTSERIDISRLGAGGYLAAVVSTDNVVLSGGNQTVTITNQYDDNSNGTDKINLKPSADGSADTLEISQPYTFRMRTKITNNAGHEHLCDYYIISKMDATARWIFDTSGTTGSAGELMPASNNSYDIGDTSHQVKDIWVAGTVHDYVDDVRQLMQCRTDSTEHLEEDLARLFPPACVQQAVGRVNEPTTPKQLITGVPFNRRMDIMMCTLIHLLKELNERGLLPREGSKHD